MVNEIRAGRQHAFVRHRKFAGRGGPATSSFDAPLQVLVHDTASEPSAPKIAGIHILLVDDDPDTREVLRVILESDGFHVTSAVDGLDALRRLEQLRGIDRAVPCVVVLDYMMPRCSGPQFRERQLADPVLADIPVILVSAISDLARLEPLDPFAVLQKPIEPDVLTDVVRRACESAMRH